MKYKSLRFVCAFMTAILMLISGIAVTAYTAEYDSAALAYETLDYKMSSEGASGVQDFIDGWLTENAGTGSPEWYALCLSRESGYDFSAFTAALEQQIDAPGLKATNRQRIALAYHAAGGTNIDIGAVIDETWNGLGIMSEIYALILINSGDFSYSADETEIVSALLARQHDDGGWSLSGSYSDADVTAMALQALSAYRSNPDIEKRIDRAVDLLSAMQRDDGGYQSYGTPSAESCAQVVIALCQLDIDPQNDSRFVKNGSSPVSALMSYRCESGGFSHISGGSENAMAVVQAFEAFTAVSCGGLYELTKKNLDISVPELPGKPAVTTVSAAPVTTSVTDKKEQVTGVGHSSEPSGSGSKTSAVQPGVQNNTTTVKNVSGNPSAEDDTSGEPYENQSGGNAPVSENSSSSSSAQTEPITVMTTVSSSASSASEKSSSAVTQSSVSVTETAESSAATVTAAVSDNGGTYGNSGAEGWKMYSYITIAGLLVLSQIYLAARKQFSWKRLAAYAAVCSVCAGAVFLIRIQSPEEYYSRNIDDIQPDSLTVTLSVSCETIRDKIDGDYMLVPETELVFLDGESAFDVLERVLAHERIPLDYTGNTEFDVYVRGIGGIYEMDHGEMSGWMYTVNGEFPDVGCGAYELSDGDEIMFVYTCDIGRDLVREEKSE